jgi:hypothetical protein
MELDIMEREHLTPSELFITQILLHNQLDGDPELLGKYVQIPESDRDDFREILLSLQRKGCILKSFKIPEKGAKLNPHDIEFNKNFVNRIFRMSMELGRELFDAYPDFAMIQGSWVSIKTISKKFNSPEDASIAYARAIRNDPNLHKEILEIIKWANENGLINFTLASFIVDRRWEALRKLKNGEVGNVNFNNVTML